MRNARLLILALLCAAPARAGLAEWRDADAGADARQACEDAFGSVLEKKQLSDDGSAARWQSGKADYLRRRADFVKRLRDELGYPFDPGKDPAGFAARGDAWCYAKSILDGQVPDVRVAAFKEIADMRTWRSYKYGDGLKLGKDFWIPLTLRPELIRLGQDGMLLAVAKDVKFDPRLRCYEQKDAVTCDLCCDAAFPRSEDPEDLAKQRGCKENDDHNCNNAAHGQ